MPGAVQTQGRYELHPSVRVSTQVTEGQGQVQQDVSVRQQQDIPHRCGWDISPQPRFDGCSLVVYFSLCNREHISSPSLISRMSEMSLGLNEKIHQQIHS